MKLRENKLIARIKNFFKNKKEKPVVKKPADEVKKEKNPFYRKEKRIGYWRNRASIHVQKSEIEARMDKKRKSRVGRWLTKAGQSTTG